MTTIAPSFPRFRAANHVVSAVAALTAAGLILRLIRLNSSLWYDEIYSLVVSSRAPLRAILTTYHGDIQHPLYSALAHVSIVALGECAWAVRLPAVVFGVASIPLVFLLGRSVATTREALLAAAFLTVSYHHVWFSQNARGYTALLFWTLLCTLLFLRGVELRRWPPFLGYAVAAALGTYTHLTFVFVVLSHAAIVVLLAAQSLRRRGEDRRWLVMAITAFVLSGLLSLALYAPILGQVGHFFLHSPPKMKATSTPRWALLETLRGVQLGFGSQLAVVTLGLLIGLGLWGYWRDNRLAFLVLVLPGVVTGLGVVGASGKMYPRYLFLVAGFADLIVVRGAMVLAALLARIGGPRRGDALERVIGVGSMALVIAASAATLGGVYRHPKQDFVGALQFVESARRGDEPVLTAGGAVWPFEHFYGRDWPQLRDVRQIEPIAGRARRIWLVYTFPRYIEDESPGLMAAIGRQFRTIRVFAGTLNDGAVYVCVHDVADSGPL